MRGLNAPPRMTLAPACFTSGAIASTWSRDSIVQGPAMSTTSGPPMRTAPATTTVSSGLNVRDESL